MPGTWRVPVSRQSHSRAPSGKILASLKGRYPSTSMCPQERCEMRGELSSVWRMFLSAAEAKSVSPTRALCRLLNVTNLDRKPELGRYSGMWAESQNEDQSP